jgi:hypothetical protein
MLPGAAGTMNSMLNSVRSGNQNDADVSLVSSTGDFLEAACAEVDCAVGVGSSKPCSQPSTVSVTTVTGSLRTGTSTVATATGSVGAGSSTNHSSINHSAVNSNAVDSNGVNFNTLTSSSGTNSVAGKTNDMAIPDALRAELREEVKKEVKKELKKEVQSEIKRELEDEYLELENERNVSYIWNSIRESEEFELDCDSSF